MRRSSWLELFRRKLPPSMKPPECRRLGGVSPRYHTLRFAVRWTAKHSTGRNDQWNGLYVSRDYRFGLGERHAGRLLTRYVRCVGHWPVASAAFHLFMVKGRTPAVPWGYVLRNVSSRRPLSGELSRFICSSRVLRGVCVCTRGEELGVWGVQHYVRVSPRRQGG